jgi:hypothetical protein
MRGVDRMAGTSFVEPKTDTSTWSEAAGSAVDKTLQFLDKAVPVTGAGLVIASPLSVLGAMALGATFSIPVGAAIMAAGVVGGAMSLYGTVKRV